MFGDLSATVWKVPVNPGAFQIEQCEIEGRGAQPSLVWPLEFLAQQLDDIGVSEGDKVWQAKWAFRRYCPIKTNESLYRTLATVEPTPDGILDFARKYGRLGEGIEMSGTLPDGSKATVEPLFEWQMVIVCFAEAVRLWDLAEGKDYKKLAKEISWRNGEVFYHSKLETYDSIWKWWMDKDVSSEISDSVRLRVDSKHKVSSHDGTAFKTGDLVEPAKCFVLDILNRYLSCATQSILIWDSKRKTERERVILRHYPKSLLGAIALQFATAILSGRTTRICPVCQRYYEVTAQASRNDRVTCSNRCRVRAYRDRQQRARELHAKGRTTKQIAKELGSDVDTIKNWIDKQKG
jgi:hypothetical protein